MFGLQLFMGLGPEALRNLIPKYFYNPKKIPNLIDENTFS